MVGIWLASATGLLTITGAILYDADMVGWAQMFWVFASGTAGAGVMAIIEGR